MPGRRSPLPPVIGVGAVMLFGSVLTSGCEEQSCPLVGCFSQVGVTVAWPGSPPLPLTASVCVEGQDCSAFTVMATGECVPEKQIDLVCGIGGSGLFVRSTVKTLGTQGAAPPASQLPPVWRQVTVNVTPAKGPAFTYSQNVELTAHQPNGADCGPTCFQADLMLSAP